MANAVTLDLSQLRDVKHMPSLPALLRRSGDTPTHDRIAINGTTQFQSAGGVCRGAAVTSPGAIPHGQTRAPIDFCIPINPYFPPTEMLDELCARLEFILRYYPSENSAIARHLGEFTGLDAANILAANGSTELITWINQRLVADSLATDVPTFGRWTDNPHELGRGVHAFHRRPDDGFRLDVDEFVSFAQARGASAIVVCNPNNPTGAVLARQQVLRLLDSAQSFDVVIIDESFIDFVAEDEIPSVASDVIHYPNAIVIKSLGKNLGLHGLRCGYAVANEKLAHKLRDMLPPWNVNALAEELIRLMAAYADEYETARRKTVRDSKAFAKRLSAAPGLTVFPTHANFVYCRVADRVAGVELRDVLLREYGCFVRECGSKIGSSSQYFRIATRPPDQQELLTQAIIAAMRQVM